MPRIAVGTGAFVPPKLMFVVFHAENTRVLGIFPAAWCISLEPLRLVLVVLVLYAWH